MRVCFQLRPPKYWRWSVWVAPNFGTHPHIHVVDLSLTVTADSSNSRQVQYQLETALLRNHLQRRLALPAFPPNAAGDNTKQNISASIPFLIGPFENHSEIIARCMTSICRDVSFALFSLFKTNLGGIVAVMHLLLCQEVFAVKMSWGQQLLAAQHVGTGLVFSLLLHSPGLLIPCFQAFSCYEIVFWLCFHRVKDTALYWFLFLLRILIGPSYV